MENAVPVRLPDALTEGLAAIDRTERRAALRRFIISRTVGGAGELAAALSLGDIAAKLAAPAAGTVGDAVADRAVSARAGIDAAESRSVPKP
jgi:hypothetical protein